MSLELLVRGGKAVGRAIKKAGKFVGKEVTSKEYWVDTLAPLTIFPPLMTISELGIVGMDTETWLKTRAYNLAINLISSVLITGKHCPQRLRMFYTICASIK